MVNKSKAKGTAAETAVVKYLRDIWGLPLVERRALGGEKDRGDIAGIPGVVLEVKDAEDKRLSRWRDETLAEVNNDGADLGALVVKVFRKNVADWDCWVPFWMIHCQEDQAHPIHHRYFWIKMRFADFIAYLKGEGYIE